METTKGGRLGLLGLSVWLVMALSVPGNLFAAPASEKTDAWNVSSGASVVTGKYGTGQRTTVTTLSDTVKYKGTAGELGVTVPYLIRSGNGVTAGETSKAEGQTQTIPSHAQGLGDVQVKGTFYLIPEGNVRPGVDLAGRIKFPTASADKGLGTGRFDVGLGPELFKRLTARLVSFANLEVVFRDKPSGSTIKSVRLDGSAGVGYDFTKRFTGYASLATGTPSSSGTNSPVEVVVSGVYHMTKTISVQGFALAGLNNASPDVGAGASVTFKF